MIRLAMFLALLPTLAGAVCAPPQVSISGYTIRHCNLWTHQGRETYRLEVPEGDVIVELEITSNSKCDENPECPDTLRIIDLPLGMRPAGDRWEITTRENEEQTLELIPYAGF